MLLSTQDLIQLVRYSVNVQYKEDGVEDSAYLSMTDEDILRYIKLGITRGYPTVEDIEDLPSDCSQYAIILLTKIELFTALAVLKADDVDLGVDNNNYIKQDQRFNHYMKLVDSARDLYNDYLENEGIGTVQTYEVLNSKRSHTKRYYDHQQVPQVSVKVSDITSESFNLSWEVQNISKFGNYIVAMSTDKVINKFADGSSFESKKSETAKVIKQTYDSRNNTKEVKGLSPDTDYCVAVVSTCRNGVWGYKEVSVHTLPEVVGGDEIDEDFTTESSESVGVENG